MINNNEDDNEYPLFEDILFDFNAPMDNYFDQPLSVSSLKIENHQRNYCSLEFNIDEST